MNNPFVYRGTQEYEGFRPTVYKDSRGIDTIGVGEKWFKGMPTVMDEATAINRFNKSKAKHTSSFYKNNPNLVNAPEHVKTVLEDMSYNMGPDFLTKFKKMRTALNNQNYDEAANQLLDSNYTKQVGQRAFDNAAYLANGSNASPAVFDKALHGMGINKNVVNSNNPYYAQVGREPNLANQAATAQQAQMAAQQTRNAETAAMNAQMAAQAQQAAALNRRSAAGLTGLNSVASAPQSNAAVPAMNNNVGLNGFGSFNNVLGGF